MSTLSGQRPIAIVTGANRAGRIGAATAVELARAGCDLVITHRQDEPGIHATAELCRNATGGACAVQVESINLEELAVVERQSAALAATLPRVDVLVHNASDYQPTPLEQLNGDQLERAMRINALAPALLSRALAARLATSPLPARGAIVTMCDIHAMGELGQPRKNFLAYGLSKAALLELTLVLARELAPNVRVNAIAPGVVAFPTSGHESSPELQKLYLQRVPLARAGTPEEAAAAVRWLALEATYCTGHILRIDGGRAVT